MNTRELLGTPLSPILVSITNNPSTPAVYRASGDPVPSDPSMPRYVSPYSNPDGSLNGLGVAVSLVSTASMAASAYHGYRRNDSVGWAVWWGFMGGLFPILVPTIAVAQGFGEREKK